MATPARGELHGRARAEAVARERAARVEPLPLKGEPRRARGHAELGVDARLQRADGLVGAHAIDRARARGVAHEQLEGAFLRPRLFARWAAGG